MRRDRPPQRDADARPLEGVPSAGPAPLQPPPAARLQRALGNQGLQRALARGGGAAPRQEGEADRVARELTGRAPGGVPAQARPERPRPEAGAAGEEPARLDPGRPLSPSARAFYEERLGVDLGAVRLHDGAAADELARSAGARAFAAGSDVVFAAGQHQPGEETASPLLAHELAHVAQQAGDAAAPAVQCQPQTQPPPPNFNQLLVDLQTWVLNPKASTNPAEIQTALQDLASFGIALKSLQWSRLANATWVVGGLHIGAESRWPKGGSPELAVSDDLLRDFADFASDPNLKRAAGFSVIRTLEHELRHLQRQHQRDLGTRAATTAETRFEKQIAIEAAATPAKLTSQQYAELYSGRLLFAVTAYPVEEILARLAEVKIARREWEALKSKSGGPTALDKDHIEIVLQEIGFRIYYQINVLDGSVKQGTAGMKAADFKTSIAEIEAEIKRLYGNSSPERRLWDLARSGVIATVYHPLILVLGKVFP